MIPKTTKLWKPLSSVPHGKVLSLLFVLLFAAVGANLLTTSRAANVPLIGAYNHTNPPNGFSTWLGRPAQVMGSFQKIEGSDYEWWSVDAWQSWLKADPNRIVDNVVVPCSPTECPHPGSGGTDATISSALTRCANGEFDARYKRLAQNYVTRGIATPQLVLRFAHEHTGNWYGWNSNPNPTAYGNCFRRFVTAARSVPGFNARFTWNAQLGRFSGEGAWPGNEYVDFVGLDFYDYGGGAPADRWNSFMNQTYGLNFYRQYAASKGKPLAIPETGLWTTPNGGGDNPYFMQALYDFTTSNLVHYVIYFDVSGDVDHRISNAGTIYPNGSAKFKALFGPSNPLWSGGGTTTPPPPPPPPPPTNTSQINQTGNLVAGKRFSSSAGAIDATSTIDKITDKVESTTSRYISTAGATNVAMSVDLGSRFTLSKASILWAQDTTKNFSLQMSEDNSTWTTVYTGANDCSVPPPKLGDVTAFNPAATGRYFRILANDLCNVSYGHSIWEIGLYGSAATTPVPPPAPTPDTTAPSVPGGVAASAVSTSQINLSWQPSTDNVGVVGYDVFRNNTKVASINTTSFGDTGLAAATSYSYTVVARDAAGNLSPASSSASAQTQAPAPPATAPGALTGSLSSTDGSSLRKPRISLVVSGVTRTYVPSSTGNYSITALPPGTYNVTYQAFKYRSRTLTITVPSGTTIVQNVALSR